MIFTEKQGLRKCWATAYVSCRIYAKVTDTFCLLVSVSSGTLLRERGSESLIGSCWKFTPKTTGSWRERGPKPFDEAITNKKGFLRECLSRQSSLVINIVGTDDISRLPRLVTGLTLTEVWGGGLGRSSTTPPAVLCTLLSLLFLSCLIPSCAAVASSTGPYYFKTNKLLKLTCDLMPAN
jgi:hypothetical protein